MADEMFVVCMPTRDGPAPLPSRMFFCTECGTQIWVSQPMVPVVMKGEVTPLCNPCGARMGDAEWGIHPAQEAQLGALGILEYSHEIVKAMRERGGT